MQGEKALVTGASSGIGLTFAKELAQQGYLVTAVARNEDSLRQLIAELGAQHRFIRADLTDAQDVARICEELASGKYQLLVNNAGYGLYGSFTKMEPERVHNLISLNITALVQLSQAFLQQADFGAALINVSSILSLLPYPGGAVYAATKAFVTNFSEALWYECLERNIYVMALLPGITETNFHLVASGGREQEPPGGGLSYPPEVVVQEALLHLQRRQKPTVISGPRFRWLTALATRLLPRKNLIMLMGKNSPGMQAKYQ